MADDDIPEMPTVHVEGGPIDGHSMPLSQGTSLIVGSGRLAHLRLDHPQIELAHIKITWDDIGIAMTDNGSRYGTWVNGEKVETAGLIDGDVITFAPADADPPAPRVRVRIPKGSVPEPPPLPPEPAGEAAGSAAAASRAPATPRGPRPRRARRRRALDISLPEPRILGLGAGGLVVLLGLGWLAARLISGSDAPSLSAVQPVQAEAGQKVTVTGSGFAPDAAANTVWFGDRSAPAESVAGETLQTTVPPGVPAGSVAVTVETAGGRSGAVSLQVVPTLAATELDPAGALPGDPVVLQGQGFDGEGATVSVGGVPAKVLGATATTLRFEMPAIEAAPGTFQPVVATVSGRPTNPLQIALGRLPLVVSLNPPEARTGDRVRIEGVGFPEEPAAAQVTFDGVRALVVSCAPREMTVVAPLVPGTTPQTVTSVVVRSGDKASSGDVRYPIVRIASGTYVARFFAGAGEPGTADSASLASALGPVLLLGGKQAPARAVQAARALNDLLARPREHALVFAAQDKPEAGIGVEGAPALLLETTAADAAVYAAARGAPPTTAALARWWAALLTDYVAIVSGPEAPAAVAAIDARSGATFAELRRALPWQYRSGVANERVAALPEPVRARMREVMLAVP
jgi:hypothetical protein